MNERELLDLLSHKRLRALTNHGDRWSISYLSFDMTSTSEIRDDDFNALIQNWQNVAYSLDTYDAEN